MVSQIGWYVLECVAEVTHFPAAAVCDDNFLCCLPWHTVRNRLSRISVQQ